MDTGRDRLYGFRSGYDRSRFARMGSLDFVVYVLLLESLPKSRNARCQNPSSFDAFLVLGRSWYLFTNYSRYCAFAASDYRKDPTLDHLLFRLDCLLVFCYFAHHAVVVLYLEIGLVQSWKICTYQDGLGRADCSKDGVGTQTTSYRC